MNQNKTNLLVFCLIVVIFAIISLVSLKTCGRGEKLGYTAGEAPQVSRTPDPTPVPETKKEDTPAAKPAPKPEPTEPAPKPEPPKPAPTVKPTTVEAPKEAPEKPAPTAPQKVAETEKPAATTPLAKTAAPNPAPEAAEKAPTGTKFASVKAAVTALAGAIQKRDFPAVDKIVNDDAMAKYVRPRVQKLVTDPEITLSTETPFSEISRSATGGRWALNFVKAPKPDAFEGLYADIHGSDEDGFYVEHLALPLRLRMLNDLKFSDTEPMAEELPTSALGVAHAFARSVTIQDFDTARALADSEKLSDERIAALMIALDEGDFDLASERPLVMTLKKPETSWVIARVEEDTKKTPRKKSEFAIEMARAKGSDPWRVDALTFSKVIASLADDAGAGDVAYAPIVETPKKGDSLVVFFDFDGSEINPRAKRQLEIISSILKGDAKRSVTIGGHADAIGSDQYNLQLSSSRAAAIKQTLLDFGVAEAQVKTDAFGEFKPLQPNFKPDGSDNPSGRSENRRAEVYLDF